MSDSVMFAFLTANGRKGSGADGDKVVRTVLGPNVPVVFGETVLTKLGGSKDVNAPDGSSIGVVERLDSTKIKGELSKLLAGWYASKLAVPFSTWYRKQSAAATPPAAA